MNTYVYRRLATGAFRISAILITLSCFFFSSCNRNGKPVKVDPEFSKYIESYTSGVVSKKAVIRVRLAADASVTHAVNETIPETLFNFSPSVKGKAYWVDARTIEFKPQDDLEKDRLYEISFSLGKLIHVPSRFSEFKFNIQTSKPSFHVESFGLRSQSKTIMTLRGEITTADAESSAAVEKLLKAELAGTSQALKWQHNEATNTHGFLVENIQRGNTEQLLTLSWDGNAISVSDTGSTVVHVPAQGDFKVLDVRVVQDEEQYALVQFSDPLQPAQQLDGLISIAGQENLSYTILGSEVKVYAGDKLEGRQTLNVYPGIRNAWSDKLDSAFTANIFFENRLPSAKIHGRGVILPSGDGRIVLPFDAVNLNAVDVSIIKIYENNIPQFLQTNKLEGTEELRRVGSPLVQATMKLDTDAGVNLHKRNRYFLDLDKYIKTEPGAIYRVTLAFRREYSLYTCTDTAETKDEGDDEGDYYHSNARVDDDDEFWRQYEEYYFHGYNWQKRNNPCSRSYYTREKFDGRNILVTNIGLTAKCNNGNNLFVSVNNILTTAPISGVDMKVLDYQQQVIGKGTSNGEGICLLDLKRKPWLLVASKGTERSYLRLDDGSALPLSRFDVGGVEVKNGIKGFVFGERGVWRPGDSLFLGCIIEDRDKKLPAGHPVEMELVSPKGQLYKRLVQPNAADGFNVFRTATDASAPTGNWLCRVKLGGVVFEKKLKIETVMPNRLKIDLNFGKATALGKNTDADGTLSAKWLFGATAQNLKARVDAQLYKKTTSFKGFTGYSFDNPVSSFTPQSKTIFDGTLGADGTATINPGFDAGAQAPGMLLANLAVKVFEPGGNFSIDNITMPYHPYTSYAGIRIPEGDKQWGFLLSGKTQSFGIVDVNTEGQLTTGKRSVEVQLYKIQWRWWWDDSGDDFSNFTQDRYTKLVKKETLVLNNGRGNYQRKWSDDEYGRYLVLVKDEQSGHTTGKVFFVDSYDWQSRNESNDPGAAAMLSFTSDKPKYNVGDDVQLTIPSGNQGKVLISIETGSKVLKTYRVDAAKGATKFSFRAEKEMTPNVFVNVSMLQPHAQTVNDLPIRMYGVIPVEIEDRNTVLKPQISMPDVIRPEQKTTITVSEANGKDMSYVLAVVDEGLLDLTRFKTPDPHASFYAREALGVKSWDVYDYVIGAWGGELQRILTIGGDGEGELASKTRKANRFKAVVQFMGPFRSSGGKQSHSLQLPPYMGSVRVMLIAAADGRYGMAEKAVKVKKPLMLFATVPRVLGPTETVKIPVTVFATDNSVKNVTVRLATNGLLSAGSAAASIHFNGPGEQTVLLDARAGSHTGIGKITVSASSGRESAQSDVELDIRNANPPVTLVTEAVLQPGQTWSTIVNRMGEGPASKAMLEVSSIPAINLEKRLRYLIGYPHGCIEQTVSAVFPQLVLDRLLNLTDDKKAEIDRNIRAALQKFHNFQAQDGGFSYWPDDSYSNEWGSNYAGHFLLEAAAKGYNVPAAMLQQWKLYERSKALAWNMTAEPYYGSDLVQAYRLYLLALAKAPEIGAMNRLREYRFLTTEAKWSLAAAYQLAGQSQVALQMISGLPTRFPERNYWGISFGSALRDQAIVLQTLITMNRKTEAADLVKDIAAQLSREDWYSTQTTAFCLLSIARFAGGNKTDEKINISGQAGSSAISVKVPDLLSQTAIGWQQNKASVKLVNKGSNVLYVRVINEGQPLTNESIPVISNPSVLQVNVEYLNNKSEPVDITHIKQGTDFMAKVTVRNPGNRGVYDQMALTQIFPSGWEILNTRLYNSEGAFKSSASQYMDIRDDRVMHYFTIRGGETLTYYVQLNAAYTGSFYWPGVYCEAMYDHSISGGIGGKWIQVTE
jgi:uncharacterized protein YfaS (alpha-2-macroglobulin family)